MPDPTRPVAGAPIDTDWGQQMHDRVFQPPGVRVADLTGQTVSSVSYEQIGLNDIIDDPGGWVSGDTLVVPTGRGGLYTITTLVSTVGGDDGFNTLFQVRINGSTVVKYIVPHDDGGATQIGGGTILYEFAAGDEIEWYEKRSGGAVVTGKLLGGDVVMIGTSIGA